MVGVRGGVMFGESRDIVEKLSVTVITGGGMRALIGLGCDIETEVMAAGLEAIDTASESWRNAGGAVLKVP